VRTLTTAGIVSMAMQIASGANAATPATLREIAAAFMHATSAIHRERV
jgi:hypothetical protein